MLTTVGATLRGTHELTHVCIVIKNAALSLVRARMMCRPDKLLLLSVYVSKDYYYVHQGL